MIADYHKCLYCDKFGSNTYTVQYPDMFEHVCDEHVERYKEEHPYRPYTEEYFDAIEWD